MKTLENFQDASGLINKVITLMGLKNDAALARSFDLAPPVLSKLRSQAIPVGNSFILKCHEIAGMTLPEIRSYVGGQA